LPYAPLVLHTFEWGGLEGLTADDRVAQLSSLSYVMGLLRVLGVLVRGATLCAYDLQERGVRDLPAWMRAQRITMVTGVPSIFRTLRDLVPPDEPIDSVRRVNLFGETVIDTDVRDARALFGADVVVANQFGATEVGGISMYEVLPGTEPPAGPLPAGTTWVGASIVLVDDDDQPVAAGEAGRIIVVNDTMALGYWDAPALTAECFFTTPDGHRGFRTSDRARWRPDGLLEHLGRLDSSVKVRGTMVATNEVEAALTMLAEVTEAAVVAVPDRDGGNHLVAYVAMRSGERPGAWQVRRDVARLVPAAMVPASVVVLDALPHGVRGKIDRAALPPPPAGAAYAAPSAPVTDPTIRGLCLMPFGPWVWMQTTAFAALQ
jgi:acyl-coenzyme A synthetase/AMP-(fatty) acid ligase